MTEHNTAGRIRRLRLIFNIILGLILALAAVAAGIMLLCGIETVQLAGTDKYTAEEVRGYVLNDPYANDNTVLAWGYSQLHPRTDIPFLSSVTVRITGMNSLLFEAREKTYAGYFGMADGRMIAYFDEDGAIADVSERFYPQGVRLEGAVNDTATIGIGDPLPLDDSDRKSVVKLISSLKEQKIDAAAIRVSENGELFVYVEETLHVSLGTRMNLDQKMARLPQILEKLRERSGPDVHGILHMETWTPESTDIVFEEGEPEALTALAEERTSVEVDLNAPRETEADENAENAENAEDGTAEGAPDAQTQGTDADSGATPQTENADETTQTSVSEETTEGQTPDDG